MKKILLSTVAFAGLTAGAMAADLPMRAAPPPPVPMAVPVFTWSGLYVGVNVGWAFTDNEDRDGRDGLVTPRGGRNNEPFDVVPAAGGSFLTGSRRSGSDDGILGGGQVGYNMQFGMFVAGIEADIQAIDLEGGRSGGLTGGVRSAAERFDATRPRHGIIGATNNVFFGGFNGANGEDVDLFGTVRGRLGVAFDRTLVYATGGLAWRDTGDNDGRNGTVGTPPAGFFSTLSPGAAARGARNLARINRDNDFDAEDIGFTVGGGIEYAFTNSISVKLEGLYVDFSDGDNGGRNNRIVGVTNTGRVIKVRGADGVDGVNEFGLVRVGLNWRFPTF
jgi:outer membrane immunogenic protein